MAESLEVADLLFELARQVRRRTAERVPELTPGRLRAMRRIEQHGPMRMGELADLLGVAPRSVTDLIDELDESGLVSRVPDPDDRRATLVTSTAAGSRLLKTAERVRSEVVEEVFAPLTDQQLEQLKKLLTKVLLD